MMRISVAPDFESPSWISKRTDAMLSPDQVKPFLYHPDEDVRGLAASYFGDCWSQDPDVLPRILDAREKFGATPFFQGLWTERHLVITAETLDRLLVMLDGADSERLAKALGELIAKAPADLLRERAEAIRTRAKLSPEVLRCIERRQEYLDWTGERLWDELRNIARRQEDADRNETDDEGVTWDLAREIIDALATRDVPDADTIHRLLGDPEIEDTWLEIHLTSLVGRRRLSRAIPHLIANYHEEEADFLIEETTEALARIGDVETIGLLVDEFAESDWTFKFCAANTLGDLKYPESEAAILELLKSETDSMVRTLLCTSLCQLISEHALETIRKEIASGSREAFRETASLVLAVAEMLGQALPRESVQWRRESNRQHEAMKQMEAEWQSDEASGSTGRADHALGMESSDQPGTSVEPTRPIRHDGPRAGRNDPCPCGSGKKYKKCCGASR
jgi:hypothetical protein